MNKYNAGDTKRRRNSDKNVRCVVRITEEERAQLEEMSVKNGVTLSEIVRNGIRMQYNLHKFKS